MPSGSDSPTLMGDIEAAPPAVATPATEPPAVIVEHVSVRYRATKEHRSITGRLRHRKAMRRTIHALDDVSFEVPNGCVYSVIGPNGAGKSTLFRVVGGIIPPVEGRVTLHARVTPLLSLGVGFNQRLTGRENILLGGLASGLDPEQVREKIDTVIEFSELGEAIDYPMRTYSSGMSSRLGFSVAAHLDPDLILIDEALAAGDAHFKRKSLEKIEQLCAAECTVMIVSHGLGIVKQLAERCLWLEAGKVMMEGEALEVVDAYLASQGEDLEGQASTDEDF